MPAITLSAGVVASLPAEPDFADEALHHGQARQLVFVLISGDASWGWQSDVTASGATNAGIPLAINTPVAQAADDLRLSNPKGKVYLISAAGGVVNYQIMYQ